MKNEKFPNNSKACKKIKTKTKRKQRNKNQSKSTAMVYINQRVKRVEFCFIEIP